MFSRYILVFLSHQRPRENKRTQRIPIFTALHLPMHDGIGPEEREYIADSIINFLKVPRTNRR